MKCPNCKKQLFCEGEFDYQDFGIEAEGVVQIYYCNEENCITEQVQIFMNLSNENEK